MAWVGFALGLFVLPFVSTSVLFTLVIPRAIPSRLSVFVSRRLVRTAFLFVANRFDDFARKDRVLALSGPISLLTLLFVWIVGYLFGFALLLWPLAGHSFATALREAGSSMFTLGFATSPHSAASTAVDFAAAGTGLLVVALEIGYLPTIYASFNRRETLVTVLQSRAGVPAWGPEILARHQLVGLMANLPAFYREWEYWAADVAESHANYPVLITFRSPHPLRSWVLGLLSVLDAAALQLALDPAAAPTDARLCLRMGFVALRDIANVLKIPHDPDPRPDAPLDLTYDDFLEGVRRLEEVGFPMERSPEEAWPHFRGWRVNYESISYALADFTVAAPAPWSGPRSRGGTIEPLRPVDRTPEDPEGHRNTVNGRWQRRD
ncbi:MAG: hypothetical protein JWO37_853 [Acidimicrobiales bacterium]|jgi:hypothetical protein|nr:hypothetical protein [Acidimicrobiales bacterium]